MTALTLAQLIAAAPIVIWIVIIAAVARMWRNTPPELYTQAELSQMLSTENQKHNRPRLRAGAISEIKNEH